MEGDRKTIYLIAAIVTAIVVGIGVYFIVKKEAPPSPSFTLEEILTSLTASKEGESISDETKKSLTATKHAEASEDILELLTAPASE